MSVIKLVSAIEKSSNAELSEVNFIKPLKQIYKNETSIK